MSNIVEFNRSMPDRQFNGERLRIARLWRDISANDLADNIGVKRQTISMYENGKLVNPDIATIQNISQALNFPLKFFVEDFAVKMEKSTTYFRSLLTTNKKYRSEQESKVDCISVIYAMLNEYLDFEPLDLPDVPENAKPEEAAYILRKYWELGNKPIENLSYVAESHGIVVTDFETSSGDVDAFSHKINGGNASTYLIGYSKNKNTAARVHFDIAHELGHILLHDWNENIEEMSREDFKELEIQANDFAAAFLLPEDEFVADVGNYASKLQYYVELKRRWKVSIAAMIRRSYKLGLITSEEYQRMMRNMQKQGIRKVEPLDDILITAKPSLLKQAVNLLLSQKVFTANEFLDEISSEYGLTLFSRDIEKLLGLDKDTLKVVNTVPELKVVLKSNKNK
jgi:Predicted Zn peptidase